MYSASSSYGGGVEILPFQKKGKKKADYWKNGKNRKDDYKEELEITTWAFYIPSSNLASSAAWPLGKILINPPP